MQKRLRQLSSSFASVLHGAANVLPGGIGKVEVGHHVAGLSEALATLPR